MTYREKLVNGLKDLPYHEKAIDDVIVWLESCTPMMLSKDRAKILKSEDDVWLEQLGADGMTNVTAMTVNFSDETLVHFKASVECRFEDYNVCKPFGWRLWTMRPSDEESMKFDWEVAVK